MSFAELHDDFLAITASTVFCTATTVDGRGRPRNRILHPIFIVRDTPPPLGWGQAGLDGYGPDEWRSEIYTPLRA